MAVNSPRCKRPVYPGSLRVATSGGSVGLLGGALGSGLFQAMTQGVFRICRGPAVGFESPQIRLLLVDQMQQDSGQVGPRFQPVPVGCRQKRQLDCRSGASLRDPRTASSCGYPSLSVSGLSCCSWSSFRWVLKTTVVRIHPLDRSRRTLDRC